MGNDVKISVNKNKLEYTISNINYYLERIQEIFNNLEKEFLEVKDCYITNSSKIYFNNLEQFKTGFNIICKNITSYKNDLEKLISSIDEQDLLLTKKMESAIDEINTVYKKEEIEKWL